ncbi:MAG: NAD(P)/FAD-dependent oxidoreductase [Desulfatitalea sp.]|nr:NAD(P)/FAD-dependent oxidoreductase [Desulfatitalea sp.]
MATTQHVIIGNGIAGISAAEVLRAGDPDSAITIIGDESETPYCRPMISLVLEGALGPERLPIRGTDYYQQFGITPVLGRRVTAVDTSRREVHINGARPVIYDKLLIASGADPRPVKAEGRDLDNIFYLRHQAHVRGMLAVMPDARKALVLGGGLVGFKAAYGLLRRGIQVTMLIRSGYPLSMQADAEAGRMVLTELRAHGLEVRVGAEVTAFEGGPAVRAAVLSDGSRLACDLVVIGKGVLPSLAFVRRDQIAVDLGIVVDRHMRTTAPDVYAAGDVAEGMDLARGTRWVNAIWPEAVAQGRLAGTNMAGREVAGEGSLGRNVIRIFGLDIMTGGIVDPPADDDGFTVVSALDPRRRTYRKLVFQKNRLVGMVMVNAIEQGGVLLGLIQSRMPVRLPAETLLANGFNYKQLLME